jgi:probable HAF family extracellular repeat protein
MTDNVVSQARARLSRTVSAIVAALAVLSTAGQEVTAKHAASFVATDLGTLGGRSSQALAVNSRGVVVGRSSTEGDSAVHAFTWSEDTGIMTDLQPDIQLPSLLELGVDIQSLAAVIGNDGVIAGFGFLTDASGNIKAFHAFVRTDANGVVDLSEQGTFENSSPTAVNSKGAVVGFATQPGDTNRHAFLWTQQRGVEDLGTLGGSSMANAISDNGIVVGESTDDQDHSHAFMWTRHNGMLDLGTLRGGLTSVAQAVNNDRVIVGNSLTDQIASDGHFINHAFVWTKRDGMVDIGSDPRFNSFDSFAEKINGRFVVGHITKDKVTHGFVWTRKGGFVDVGTLLDDTSSLVTGVNDRGLVIGNSFVSGTPGSRAFVWTASSGIVPLDSPLGGSTEANAINGDFIVGSSCDVGSVVNCHATLWKPLPHSRKDRGGDDDD